MLHWRQFKTNSSIQQSRSLGKSIFWYVGFPFPVCRMLINFQINNAGAATPDSHGATGINQNLETYEKTFALNVRSVISLIQKARPHLATTHGDIVNVSSIAAGPQAVSSWFFRLHELHENIFLTSSTSILTTQYRRQP